MSRARTFAFEMTDVPNVRLAVHVPRDGESPTLQLEARGGGTPCTTVLATFSSDKHAAAAAHFLIALSRAFNRVLIREATTPTTPKES